MSDPRYARSFETVAELYERARPEYAEAAVDWLVERLGLQLGNRVLELGAGTGKLTRQLVRRGLEVVAVEPGDEMRGVLQRVLPDVEALAGTAEAIPLPDDSVDAITAGQAFHWFDAEAALAEMRRVLRTGRGFALLWNRWDKADPLLGPIDELLNAVRPPADELPHFKGRYEERTFHERRALTVDAIVGWASSTSGFVNASREEQHRIEEEIGRLAEGYGGFVAISTLVIVVS